MIIVKRSMMAMSRYLNSRAFAVSVLAIILAFAVYTMTTMTNAISIRDGLEVRYAFTQKRSVGDILSEQGIQTIKRDKIEFAGFSGKYGEISIDRAFPVTITADGSRRELYVLGGTVKDALAQAGITLAQEDIVNLPLTKDTAEKDNIVVNRVKFVTYDKTEAIEHRVIDKESPLIKIGSSRRLSKGYDGEKILTIQEKYIDGKLKETNVLNEKITKEAEDSVMLRGAKIAESPLALPDGFALDENGVPTNFKAVLTDQVATAYSCKPGMWGASGLPAVTGYVAVDPTVIPYGTKLYIATPDNKFVYGYCIAGDTGTGLRDGIINVDLMFDSYFESTLFGRKTVNIYILE